MCLLNEKTIITFSILADYQMQSMLEYQMTAIQKANESFIIILMMMTQ